MKPGFEPSCSGLGFGVVKNQQCPRICTDCSDKSENRMSGLFSLNLPDFLCLKVYPCLFNLLDKLEDEFVVTTFP